MLGRMFDYDLAPWGGSILKFMCMGCGADARQNVSTTLAFNKFVNLQVDSEGLCRKCKSNKILLKDPQGRQVFHKTIKDV